MGLDPGAHIDIHLDDGRLRSYSLVNDASERHRYEIAVLHEPNGRGGSAWLHRHLAPGAVVRVERPRNNFPLAVHAAHSVFIAGGIGVTPFLGMAARLSQLGRSWQLHYRARSPDSIAFRARLAAPSHGQQVRLYDDPASKQRFCMRAIVEDALSRESGTHLYCCGPRSMVAAFESCCAQAGAPNVHVEHFCGAEPAAAATDFRVYLQRTGLELQVRKGESILQCLRAAGLTVPSSCEQGVCGQCETQVLHGEPDHRDLVLTAQERASGTVMMLCCSGALSQRLVLDL
jgi:vanillate O-demethylase ferredoxin subunit